MVCAMAIQEHCISLEGLSVAVVGAGHALDLSIRA
jgi:hypothetical protein